MGKTIIIFKVNPKEGMIDKAMDDLKALKKGTTRDVQKVPIGFGIEILKAAVLIEEKEEGALAELEKEVSELDSVESSEVENMTLL